MPARPTPAESTGTDALRFGPVHLEVTDTGRSRDFWERVVGLAPAEGGPPGGIALGAGGPPLVVLHPGATSPVAPGHSGLYHLALHVPDEAAFAGAIQRAAAHRWHQAPTDHITHWATYLNDPDGIQLEIAFETIDRVQRYESGPDWPVIVDSAGQRRSAVEPLDMDAVLPHAPATPQDLLPAGTLVGHVHLHVRHLETAQAFYDDVIGFTRNVTGPRLGFADLSLGGTFPHRLAVNTWQRPGSPRPAGSAGMRHMTLDAGDGDVRAALSERLANAGHATDVAPDGTVILDDPSGTRVAIT
jgi:catechol 2,3-dioxygenase